MRLKLFMLIFLTSIYSGYSQHNKQNDWKDLIKASDSHLNKIIASNDFSSSTVDVVMQNVISIADRTFLLSELITVVNICSEYCNKSTIISVSLTSWLNESHPIYANRTPTEANQFRGFVLSSLSKLPPNEELYKYVKFELLFAGHAFNIAAAAAAARRFTNKSSELVPLMEPFLNSLFHDEWVDITTPELNYPIANPTKARYEIILSLIAFGPPAFRSVKLLDEIVECKNCGSYGGDSTLYTKALKATEYLRKVTPVCCQKETIVKSEQPGILLIDNQNRKNVSMRQVKLIDQEGKTLEFDDLMDKPFVLTFFYTQCTNALKCVSTVHRLGELEEECNKNNLAHRVGIYGITYDPDFDTPSILKKYGKMYGIKFSDNMKLLKTADNSFAPLINQLKLRVSYGAGSVNQHGLQLFVFDKKGKLAAVCDNDLWNVNDVYKILNELIKE